MKRILLILLLYSSLFSTAQTGTITGTVTDAASEAVLPGATVAVEGSSGLTAVTDAQGHYRIERVPVGRQTLQVAFMGYGNASLSNLYVPAGKEVQADVRLTENFNKLDEVVINSESKRQQPLNKLAVLSARQVSVEEINRYAGGRSDIARLAANFAGVSAPNDSRNDIVVRGNSPTGMLWRIEGIPVPNPNHFSTLGTTGSPVSALNPNVLANSDFITSAFPAEYGNAIGGVFDINFRKGNRDRYEYTLSSGAFSGAEAMAEGPLGTQKDKSFVIAARYGLAAMFGAGGTSARPNYSDIAFNIDLGKYKAGSFSVFAIGGQSDISFRGDKIKSSDLFAAKDENTDVTSKFGVVGVKNVLNLNSFSTLKTTIGISSSANTVDYNRIYNYGTPNATDLDFADINNTETRITLSSYYNNKISNRLTVRAGVLAERFQLNAKQSSRDRQADANGDGYPDYVSLINTNDGYNLLQPFGQAQYRITEKLTLNAGLHGQYFSLNNAFKAEPRTALTYAVTPNQTLSAGYGLHHQNVPAPLLFLNEYVNGVAVQSNRKLGLVQSNHYVLGYDIRTKQWHVKAEVYYQDISHAAVQAYPSSYSSLTEGSDFVFSIDKTGLVSNGKGYNTGAELTIEKNLSKGWYTLFTASVFEARYKGSDGIERNSPYNNTYVVNVLGGREFKVGKGKNVLFADSRLSTAGGRRYTPVNLAASQAAGYEIKYDEQAFSKQYSPYFRLDVKFGMRINSAKKRMSHQFYLDLQNVTDNQNVFVRRYNRITNQVDASYQIGFFPDFGYKLQF